MSKADQSSASSITSAEPPLAEGAPLHDEEKPAPHRREEGLTAEDEFAELNRIAWNVPEPTPHH